MKKIRSEFDVVFLPDTLTELLYCERSTTFSKTRIFVADKGYRNVTARAYARGTFGVKTP